MLSGALDRTLPARLGPAFRQLIAYSWLTHLADGIRLAAGPLLVASQTSSPLLVAMAATVQHLPWLLFSVYAGALADRIDRRRMLVVVGLARAAILGLLTLSILTGAVSVMIVLVCLAVLGSAQVFSSTTEGTLLPMVVPRDALPLGNARLQLGYVTLGELAGPPLGAALFAAGMAWPFAAQLILLVAAALFAASLRLPPVREEGESLAELRHEIAEGARWVVSNPAVRTLVITIAAFNVTFGAAWSVLVLYATQRLGLGEIGFGLITSVTAIGGLLGSLIYRRLAARFSLMAIMRFGLVYETLTHLALANVTSPWLAMPVFAAFGTHALVWTTTSITLRQRIVPARLLGRVSGIYLMATFGGMAIGGVIGGALAAGLGITAPYWFGFAGSALLVALVWSSLRHLDQADAAAERV